MSRLDGRRHWLLFAGLLVSTLLTIVVGGVGLGVALITLVDTVSIVATLSAALPYVVGTVVLSVLDVVLLVATVVAALRRLSLPRDDRLAAAAERAERTLPGLRSLGLAERFEPTPEQRRQELKRRYVEGDLTEAEFERRVREHVDDLGEGPFEDPALARALEDTDRDTAEATADETRRADSDPTGAGDEDGDDADTDARDRGRNVDVDVESD